MNLRCLHFQSFENPTRHIFLEGGGELFDGGAAQTKAVGEWLNDKGESSEAARKLAEDTERKAEEIRNGTEKQLLEMYVDLLRMTLPVKDNVNLPEFTIDKSYAKKGILEAVEMNSVDVRSVFREPEKGSDLRLLSYATVYKNFKAQGLDANYLPIGAKIRVDAGTVTVTYTDKNGQHTASSELFPWSTAEAADKKYHALLEEEARVKEEKFKREGRPGVVLDDGTVLAGEGPDTEDTDKKTPDPTEVPQEPRSPVTPLTVERLDERSEYEKRLDEKVDAFAARHGLTETFAPGTHERVGLQLDPTTGSYVASFKTPEGETVNIIVRATVDDPSEDEKLKTNLEKTLDEELARLDRILSRKEKREGKEEAETPLEKDWQRAWESIQKMVAEDPRLNGVVEVVEGRRNENGADKTIIVRNIQTDEQVYYMVGVQEKNNPQTYGPIDGQAPDAARIQDAKSINIWTWVIGNGNGNEAIGDRVAKYHRLEDFRVSSVEKGAYNTALIMAGIDPIEEPDSPALFDVIFKDRRKNKERKADEKRELAVEAPTMEPARIEEVTKYYQIELGQQVEGLIRRHPTELKVDRTIAVVEPKKDTGYSLYTVSIKRVGGGTFSVAAEVEVDDALLDAFIQKNGGQAAFEAAGVTREEARKYVSYALLTEEFKQNLDVAEADLNADDKAPTPVPSAESTRTTDTPAADVLGVSTRLSPREMDEDIRRMTDDPLQQVEWMLAQFEDENLNYLALSRKETPAPAADGSVHWSVEFTSVEGDKVTVDLTTPALDTAAIARFVEEQKAAGKNFTVEQVTQYLAYRAANTELKTRIDEARKDTALNKKYTEYLAREGQDGKERIQSAADDLGLSTRLTSQEVSLEAVRYGNQRDAIVDAYAEPYLGNPEKPFLTETYRRVNEVNADGSGLWHVEYKTPVGDIIFRVETPAVDQAAVQKYVDLQAAAGQDYNPETLTRFLGYRALEAEFRKEWDRQRSAVERNFASYNANLAKEAAKQPDVLRFEEEVIEPPKEAPADTLKLKEGTYKETSVELVEPGDGYTGLYEFNWSDRTSFRGEMKDGVPDGVGVLTLGGEEENIGPMQFVAGKASFEKSDGSTLHVTWDPELNIFDIRESRP